MGHLEELVIAVVAEVFERTDGHDAVDGLGELFPTLQQHPPAAWTVHLVERLFHVGGLVLRQRQADDVDVVLFDRPPHGGTPAAADIEQRHPGLQAQLAQRQIDLGDLSLLQRHVLAPEVGATVCLGGVQKQPEKIVGQVVVRLHIDEVRRQLFSHKCVCAFPGPRRPVGACAHP